MRRDDGRYASEKPDQVPNLATDTRQLRRTSSAARTVRLPMESEAGLDDFDLAVLFTHHEKIHMFRMSLLVAAASLLVAFRASAADFSYAGEPPQVAPVAPTRMVCDDDGNCYRTRAQRYVEPWNDDDDEDDGGEYRYHRPHYVAPGPGFYRSYDDDE
ncbi:MAG: hypothetical protein ACTHK9_11715 [Nitrobacter sp.]